MFLQTTKLRKQGKTLIDMFPHTVKSAKMAVDMFPNTIEWDLTFILSAQAMLRWLPCLLEAKRRSKYLVAPMR